MSSVGVSPPLDTILVGDVVSLQATARTASGSTLSGTSFSWTSTVPGVASVNAQGGVVGVSPGTSEIRAATEGVSGAATIVVQPRPVASITVTPTVDTIRVGEQATLSATPFDDQGTEVDQAVIWSSDDPGVASVEGASAASGAFGPLAVTTSGVVTGVAVGSTTLRASVGGVEETASIVVQPDPVASVSVDVPSELRPGLVGMASATPRTAGGAAVAGCQVVWSIADETVADIGADGAVAALSAGTTTATASVDCGAEGQSSGAAELTVAPSRVVAVGTGRWFSCALVEDASQGTADVGAVNCWGANHHGQVGNGGFVDTSTPTRVSFAGAFGGSPVSADPSRRAHELLVLGDEHACALDEAGAAWCWGDNLNGQIGDGSTVDRPTPVRVTVVPPLQALTAGEEFTCGLDLDGEAWCWGEGSDGQLGNGSFGNRSSPVRVSGGFEWAMLRAGEDGVCALTTGGAAYCWGENDRGGLGDGTVVNRSTPTPVGGPTGAAPALEFTWLGTGSDMACGIETGTAAAWCWGRNDEGQLGMGITGGQRNRPVPVTGATHTFRVLSTSGDDDGLTMCGIQDGGDGAGGPAFCWGGNGFGQVGDGSAVDRNAPVPLATDASFVYITSARYHSCGVTTTWALQCWGGDSRGQLGNGAPLSTQVEPGFVAFPPSAPFAGGPG